MSRANTRQSLNYDQTYLIQGRHTRTPQINAKRLSSISAIWRMFKLSKKNFDIFAPCLALQLGKKRASCLLSRWRPPSSAVQLYRVTTANNCTTSRELQGLFKITDWHRFKHKGRISSWKFCQGNRCLQKVANGLNSSTVSKTFDVSSFWWSAGNSVNEARRRDDVSLSNGEVMGSDKKSLVIIPWRTWGKKCTIIIDLVKSRMTYISEGRLQCLLNLSYRYKNCTFAPYPDVR